MRNLKVTLILILCLCLNNDFLHGQKNEFAGWSVNVTGRLNGGAGTLRWRYEGQWDTLYTKRKIQCGMPTAGVEVFYRFNKKIGLGMDYDRGRRLNGIEIVRNDSSTEAGLHNDAVFFSKMNYQRIGAHLGFWLFDNGKNQSMMLYTGWSYVQSEMNNMTNYLVYYSIPSTLRSEWRGRAWNLRVRYFFQLPTYNKLNISAEAGIQRNTVRMHNFYVHDQDVPDADKSRFVTRYFFIGAGIGYNFNPAHSPRPQKAN